MPPVSGDRAANTIRLEFADAPWEEVLEQLAKASGLSLQLDFPLPGRFTYHESKSRTVSEAFDLIHGVLLDRGVTLIRKSNLLLAVQLADELHWELAPHVPADRLEQAGTTTIVTTTLKLNWLSPEFAARELAPFLSPRGRIVGIPSASRLMVCDRADLVRQLRDLLVRLDPLDSPNQRSFRCYVLRHANAAQAGMVVKELFGVNTPAGLAPLFDFAQMGRQLGNSKMLEAFVPGFSMPGVVPDPPRAKVPTKVAVDDRRNALLLSGEPDVLSQADEVVRTLDVPSGDAASSPEAYPRTYRVAPNEAEQLATRIRELFQDPAGPRVVGTRTGRLLVLATTNQHAQVEKMVREARTTEQELERFALRDQDAEQVTEIVKRLFQSAGSANAPTIVADKSTNSVLVRGDRSQIVEIRELIHRLQSARFQIPR
jgi:type II secretory pathway component GspD/PulD (secretin)